MFSKLLVSLLSLFSLFPIQHGDAKKLKTYTATAVIILAEQHNIFKIFVFFLSANVLNVIHHLVLTCIFTKIPSEPRHLPW